MNDFAPFRMSRSSFLPVPSESDQFDGYGRMSEMPCEVVGFARNHDRLRRTALFKERNLIMDPLGIDS